MTTQFRPALAPAAALLLSLSLGTACRSGGGADEVTALLRAGDFEQAVVRASELASDRPDDPEAQAAHRRASAAVHLERGRRLTFDDRDEDALVEFYEAQALLPGDATVTSWVDKSRWKLAERRTREGQALAAQDELDDAQAVYEQALHYWPGHPRATNGLARVLLRQNYRAEMGESYYLSGVRFLRELELHESHHSFGASIKYQGNTEDTQRRDAQVLSGMAEERVAVARELENMGLFPAASNEYRLALLLDDDNEVALEGRERTLVFVEVDRALSDADMLIRRGRLEEAQELLAAQYGRSPRQDDAVAALLVEAEDVRLRALYDAGLLLEQDFRYPDAIEAYDHLLEESEGYYEDARTRRDTLADYVSDAEVWYAESRQASDPNEELALLRRIDIVWPEYLDVAARIEELEAEIASGN